MADYSLADIAALGGHSAGSPAGGLLGGGIGFAIGLLFSGLFGGGLFGGRGTAVSDAIMNQMQNGFDNQNSMANQRETLSAVTAGTAQSVAATNQTFHDMLGALDSRYNELVRDIGAVQVSQAQVLANQNECCCATKLLMTEQAAATNANISAGINSIKEQLAQNKIEALQAQVNQLQLARATDNVVRYPNAWTWNAGPSPFCGGCNCSF